MGWGAGLVVLVALGTVPNTVSQQPKIEYVKVEGKDCLQPIVHGKDVVPKDYTEAVLRWVEATYPGSRAPRIEAILTLPNGRADDVVHVSDTITVVTTKGETVRICFDVNVTTSEKPGI